MENNTSVNIQTYRATPEGAKTGKWDLLLDKIDRGDWKFSDTAEYKKVNSCTGYPKIPTNKPQLDPKFGCYLRCDNNDMLFRDFSIIEIAA